MSIEWDEAPVECDECKVRVTREVATEKEWKEAHINVRRFGSFRGAGRNKTFCSGECGARYIRRLAEKVQRMGGEIEVEAV